LTWIGVDVGGTFTDLVAYDPKGQKVDTVKCLSTPDDPMGAILQGLNRLNVQLEDATRFVHGTTRVTNALLEGKIAKVALITTRGFRDVVEMGRGHRARLYSVKEVSPQALVARTLRFEVPERMLADGTVSETVDLDAVSNAADQARQAGADAIAVCFLHSYANPAHEEAAAELIQAAFPMLTCTTSANTVPEIGEYERFVTTILNAAVKPSVASYLGSFEAALQARGLAHQASIMTSSGGVISVDYARNMPIQLALSGPAGGVSAAAQIAQRSGYDQVITCDMGGTSTDVCLIRYGMPTMTNQGHVGEWPSKVFQVEIETIGAGGGSIAWRDVGGELLVGPRSAGSSPGPACYGQGGSEPTLTDAHLLVGHLVPDVALGGEVTLDAAAARQAFNGLAHAIGDISIEDLALGVIRLSVVKMTSAIKAISVARGHDPRDFALLAFGGAGPMHATMLAEELGISTVIIPPVPGNLSALGFVSARARQDMVRTSVMPADAAAIRHIEDTLPTLERDARGRLVQDGLPPQADVEFRRALGIRIKGQSHDLLVSIDRAPSDLGDLRALFEAAYDARYAYTPSKSELELVSIRVTALGPASDIVVEPTDRDSQVAPQHRQIYAAGRWCEAGIHPRHHIQASDTIYGPAIVEESGSTVVIGPGWKARADDCQNLILTRSDDD